VAGGHLRRKPVGELDRGCPADLRDPERGDDPLERTLLRLLDVAVEVLGALAAEPVQPLEVLDGQPEEVAALRYEPGLEQLLERLPAGTLDVHPADEVAELLADAGWAGGIRAVVADRSLVPDDRGPADGTRGRHVVLALVARPLLRQRSHDFRDDVARFLQDHVVADPDVLPADLVEVVERGPGDGRSRDLRRREMRDRRQGPGPSDVRHDVLDDRLDLLRRELVGARPRGGPRHPPG